MESPKRKALKSRDYRRHRMMRLLNRRKATAQEAMSEIAERELMRRLRITPLKKFEDGKDAGVLDGIDQELTSVNVLPNVDVYPRSLYLETFYPGHNLFLIGHSILRGRNQEGLSTFRIDLRPNNALYNLITNNCSDSTGQALQAATMANLDTNFFTTPGDVLDFFKELYPDAVPYGRQTPFRKVYKVNVTPAEYERAQKVAYKILDANRMKRYVEAKLEHELWLRETGRK